ncbi:MAG: IS481 family transposase, partial [Clostridia bacterium]|nr:IS481 family transposase [Clostridia bacterium]
HGVTKASNRFHRSRNAIYEWKNKYDGTWKSLVDKSHRPHHHPKEHTPEEKEMIIPRMQQPVVIINMKQRGRR